MICCSWVYFNKDLRLEAIQCPDISRTNFSIIIIASNVSVSIEEQADKY